MIIGIAIFLGYLFMYILAKIELKDARWIRDEIYQSKAVSSPMTIGIFQPIIMLPLELNEKNPYYSYVIAHERTHIRKRDNLWRMIAILLTCVYWFNPLI